MKVSIIIPIYKVEFYIERCLESVFNQIYRNLEIILVDDCSPNKSMDIAKEIIEKSENTNDLSFIFVKHDINKGLSAARNSGTKVATGDYIYYLDSDDEITPTCISTMINEVFLHKQIQLVQGYTRSVPDSNYYHTENNNLFGYKNSNYWYSIKLCDINNKFPINAWNKLIKREFLINNKLYFLEGILHEDECWIFYVSKCLQSFSFIKETTYIHYINPNSIMSSINKKDEKSCASLSKLLIDVISNINLPCKGKYNRMVFLYFNAYLRRGGDKEKSKIERLLLFKLFKEHYYKMAILFICSSIMEKRRGGWRFKKRLYNYMNYLTRQDIKTIEKQNVYE